MAKLELQVRIREDDGTISTHEDAEFDFEDSEVIDLVTGYITSLFLNRAVRDF